MAKLTYACVLTRELDRLASFYQAVLQAEPRRDGPYIEFSTEPGVFSFSLWALDVYAKIAGAEALPGLGLGGVMLEFEVENVDAEFTRLRNMSELAIEFLIPPTTMVWGNRSIYFRDPDGSLINLFSHVA
jgi:catechol 2,3-dioxygenase-like lactoylglutathione lyase family enzyme